MAIKFGDILENINANRPIVDLIENNAKGLLFVSDFDDDSVSPNNGVIGIPKAKRSPGSLVLDKNAGILYCWPGALNQDIEEHTANGDDIVAGSWEDTGSTSEWIEIGTIKKRTDVLAANINGGPVQISTAYDSTDSNEANIVATLNELRTKINELITNPPRTFGKFKKGDEVVTASDSSGLTALEIIERALLQILPYEDDIDSLFLFTVTGGGIQFYQDSITVNAVPIGVTAINYDSLNENGDNIVPTSFRIFYRESQNNQWIPVGDSDVDFPDGTFTDSVTPYINTNATTFTVSVADVAQFEGLEIKVEVRDNSDEPDISGASGSVTPGSPVRMISTVKEFLPGDYVPNTTSLVINASDDETSENIGQPDNWHGSYLRSKGNFSNTIDWSLTASTANGNQNGSGLAITAYSIQYRNQVNGVFGSWGNVVSSGVTGNDPILASGGTGTSYSGSFTLSNTGWDVTTVDQTQYRVVYTDASGSSLLATFPASQQEAGETTDIHRGTRYRFPIFAGFADIGGGTFALNYSDYTITSAIIQGLSCTPGGLIKDSPSVAPGNSHQLYVSYGTQLVGRESFPLLVENLGYADSTNNVQLFYDSSQGSNSNVPIGSDGAAELKAVATSAGTINNNYNVIGLYHRTNDMFTNNFGWIHNSPEADEGGTDRPDSWPDALQGNSDTRFVLAVPDGGTGTRNYGLSIVTDFRPQGNTEGTQFGTLSITNSYGATKQYVVSTMDTSGACNSLTKRVLFKIDSLA